MGEIESETETGAKTRAKTETETGAKTRAETESETETGAELSSKMPVRADGGSETEWRVNLTTGLIAGVGVWILMSPVLMTGRGPIVLANVLTGIAIAILAVFNGYRGSVGRSPHLGVVLLIVLLGIWTLASPFVWLEFASGAMAITPEPLVWSNVIAGALTTVLGGYALFGSVRSDRSAATGI